MANEFVARKGFISLGSQTFPTRQITASTTFASNDYAIEVTSGSFDVFLPTASSVSGKNYILKNSGSGSIKLKPQVGQTIDGASEVALFQYSSVLVVSNGTNWYVAGVDGTSGSSGTSGSILQELQDKTVYQEDKTSSSTNLFLKM